MRNRVIGMYGYRMQYTSIHTSTGYTTFELVYCFKSSTPSALQENPSVQYNHDDFLAELKDRLQTVHSIARERSIRHKQKSKEYYDRNTREATFRIGDKVLLYDETVR
jgi:hypothetical protein